MKYIFLFMLSMSALICCDQQDVTGGRVIAKNVLYLKNRWLYEIQADTTYSSDNAIATSLSIKTFVAGRINGVAKTYVIKGPFMSLKQKAGVHTMDTLDVCLPGIITNTGVTGNQTINNVSGTVNIASGQSSITVSNSFVTARSLVYAVIRTNDATALIKNVVPSAGNFVIHLNASATSETSVRFLVIPFKNIPEAWLTHSKKSRFISKTTFLQQYNQP